MHRMIVEHCCGADAENAESGLGYAAFVTLEHLEPGRTPKGGGK